jgi:hypothetical protein
LERAADARYIVEKRYFAEFAGKTISGQIDVFDTETGTLSDYKVCSRYVAADGVKEDWIAQCSINRLLMQRNGVTAEAAQIVAIFRDWSKMQVVRDKDYPARQVAVLKVPLWPVKQTEQYVIDRIALHEAARDNPPVCDMEERWERPTRWAHMQKGKKRAIKLYDTKEQAEAAAEAAGGFAEQRPGEATRCLHYCGVSAYCEYGRSLQEENH